MENKKQKIIEVAKELIVRYGIKSVTMDEIANAAGISKKTIYQFFEDKKDLIRQIIYSEISRAEKKILEIVNNPNLNPIDRSVNIHRLIIDMHTKQPPVIEHDLKKFYPDLFEEVRAFVRDRMYKEVVKNLEEGVRQGYFRKDLKPKIIAAIQMSRFEVIKMNYHFVSEYSLVEILREVLKYHLYGICSEKGRKYLETLNL